MILQPADVVLCRGMSVAAAAIRLATTDPQERGARQKTVCNHVGLISRGGPVNRAWIIESLPHGTVERRLSAYQRPGADAAVVYRLQTITYEMGALIVALARRYVGRRYGWAWIAAHAVDWVLGSRWWARGMIPAGYRYPVCSGLVARAYETVDYRFRAIEAAAVQPDDIWDDITCNVPPWVPVGVL